MKRYYINWPVFLLGNVFGLIETAYFGWNMTPGSESEVIADGIAMLIVALSIRVRPALSEQEKQG